MAWRGPAVLALLVVLGAVGGFGMSRGLADASVGEGAAQPVGTEHPSPPGDEAFVPRDDPTDAPLLPGIELTEARLGTGRSAIVFPVPVGWKANYLSADVVKWKKPKTSNNTYVMRVTDVRSRNQTADAAIDTEIAAMDANRDKRFIPLSRNKTSIEYTYISTEGRLRHSFMSWVDLDEDGLVDAQVVVHGRDADVPGTSDLIERVVAGLSAG